MRAHSNYNKPKKLNAVNQKAYLWLGQVQKALIALNTLGLEVSEIEFCHVKPRILVKDCAACARLEASGRAIEDEFGNGEGGKYRKLQIMAEGIKVIWQTNRERKH
jgi:hypothetical protein